MENIGNVRTASRQSEEARDREIREYFSQETDSELRMELGNATFALIRIDPDDTENIRKFAPYCAESPVGKYGLVWSASCLRDLFVFDTREYAVDFIVMSRAVERE